MAHRLVGLLALILGVIPVGCVKKDYPGEAPVVSTVALEGADAVDRNEVLAGLATAASPRFLGIWDGVVFDYELFDETLLERDLERIQRYYRARGYYEANVTAARVVRTDTNHVRVELRVVEGTPVLIAGNVTTPGLERLPFAAAVAANNAVGMRPGDRFDETTYENAKTALVRALADEGYAFAKAEGHVQVDIARHEATVRIDVTPGPHAVFGPVHVVGLKAIPEAPIRRNLGIVENKDYSHAELEDARTALVNLGVFATVDVRQDLSHPEKAVVPVTVTVEEAPLRTLKVGGGLRFDVLEFSSNVTVGWEHRNFLGGLRRLNLELKPGLVFYPTRMDNFQAPRKVLPEARFRAQLDQPAFIEGRTRGFVAAEYDVYPLLYPGLGENPSEHENVIGYQEVKLQFGASRAFFGHHLYLTPSYSWQANFPFTYIGITTLDTVHISYPELDVVVDLRDDPIEPHRGLFFTNSVQVAGYLFGGDASDVREQPELRTYVPISKNVTFATRATVGFLFPSNYGSTLRSTNPGAAQTPQWQRDQQLLLFRAFYSGGPNSNRGYPFRGVGPQGVLGYLLPSTAGCADRLVVDQACYRPLGGLTLWEASAEVRFPIFGPLRAALFVDASDVVREVGQIRFTYPHVSPGIGLRYATPVGPIRLDIGYRVPYLQKLGAKTVPPEEGTQSTIFGAPIAVSFALGESF
ncbi:MAG TPA: BamA/TamA family outer membrane protein [Polyangiaceae bacterium]|nr:BamA/TamA family outer membrane protein [Polyangiaceae bacterium]